MSGRPPRAPRALPLVRAPRALPLLRAPRALPLPLAPRALPLLRAPLALPLLLAPLALPLLLALLAGLAACRAPRPPAAPLGGRWHTMVRGETLASVAARYRVTVAELIELNALPDPSRVAPGIDLYIPEEHLVPPWASRPTMAAPRERVLGVVTRGARRADPAPALAWPLAAPVTSPFGRRDGRPHDGIDLSVPDGTLVQAAADGVVAYAGERIRGYGRLVLLEHAGGLVTVYAHNAELLVREGERVARGQAIARSGHTGRVTAPHLHFEVRAGGRPIDPLPLLPGY